MRINEKKKIVADYNKMLIEKHWDQAHTNTKERMWISGLYAATWGLVLSGRLGGNNSYLVFLIPVFFGLFGLLFCLKLNYLYEFHLLRAQVYLAGDKVGTLTNFGPNKMKFLSISYLFCLFHWMGILIALSIFIHSTSWVADNEHPERLQHYYGIICDLSLLGAGWIWNKNGESFKLAEENSKRNQWDKTLDL